MGSWLELQFHAARLSMFAVCFRLKLNIRVPEKCAHMHNDVWIRKDLE